MDYLDLLLFLTSEMATARLPYEDFLQLGRAAEQGRALREGLVAADRQRRADRIRPQLTRTCPREPGRGDAEAKRLLAE